MRTPRRKSKMYTCIILGFGYGEDGSLSVIPVTTDVGFNTPEAALKDLAIQIYGKYKIDHVPERNSCCFAITKSNPSFRFCPHCGRSTGPLIDFEEYRIWLLNMHTCTIDTWKPTTELDGWIIPASIWDVIKNGVKSIVNIPSIAEYCLIAALDPKSVDDEDRNELVKYQNENNLNNDDLSHFIDNFNE